MIFTKKTIIKWDSLNEKLRAKGTRDEFYQERKVHLDQMLASQVTAEFDGTPTLISQDESSTLWLLERNWVTQEAAEQHIQFFKDLTAKYGISEAMASSEIVDFE